MQIIDVLHAAQHRPITQYYVCLKERVEQEK